ncbi:MAG: AraC family transcriptional regulator [Candidatus Competibacteraceae bacterium]|nr:AraC family transcriptional regulator [Candidatus Competibacteraceae bacterium]
MRQQNDFASLHSGASAITPPAFAERIARWTEGTNQAATAIPGLILHRWEAPTEPTSYMLAPNVCLIGQGVKRIMLGEDVYVYDPQSFLLSSVDLPVVAQILEASQDKPYPGLTLELDLNALSELMVDTTLPATLFQQACRGMAVSRLSSPLVAAVQRLLELLDAPQHIPILAPLIQREIDYWLLMSDQGPRLRQMISAGSRGHQIARAIGWLKDNFNKPFQISDLANRIGMSSSAFHQHFRALTAMTPLQFQKKLRLNEARRLMLMENLEASNAAFQVGYESPSQFSREYNRLFGAPPLRDIKNLRQISA